MFPCFINFFIFLIRPILYKRREKYIQEGIERFRVKYPTANEEQITEITKSMTDESLRIYAIVDDAILKANLQRSMFIFWVIFIVGTIMCIAQNKIPPKYWVEFITPFVLSFSSWIVSCLTIPLLYIGRVVGAMNSEIVRYGIRNRLETVEV
jgi:hypothetical protein